MLGSINSPAVTIPKDGEVCFITNTAEETKAVNINGGGKDEGADIIAWPFGRAANERVSLKYFEATLELVRMMYFTSGL